MQVILLRDVSGIGQKGSVKTVSDGHALNYLIPNRLAEMATPDKIKALEKQKTEDAKSHEARDKEWRDLVKKINNARLEIRVNASEQGHLYEKLSGSHIVNAIQDQLEVSVPTEALAPKVAIKEIGEWPVEIKLGSHKATFIVVVARS